MKKSPQRTMTISHISSHVHLYIEIQESFPVASLTFSIPSGVESDGLLSGGTAKGDAFCCCCKVKLQWKELHWFLHVPVKEWVGTCMWTGPYREITGPGLIN